MLSKSRAFLIDISRCECYVIEMSSEVDEIIFHVMAQVGVLASRQEACFFSLKETLRMASIPSWSDKASRKGLTAPLFLKKFHADLFDDNGHVMTSDISHRDYDLLQALYIYIGNRKRRESGAGDSEGIILVSRSKKPPARDYIL